VPAATDAARPARPHNVLSAARRPRRDARELLFNFGVTVENERNSFVETPPNTIESWISLAVLVSEQPHGKYRRIRRSITVVTGKALSWVPTEYRRYPRFKMSCPITLIQERQEIFTQTVDLSDGGTLVEVPATGAPAADTVLGVELQVPAPVTAAGQKLSLACKVRVVRQQSDGNASRLRIAMEFLKPLDLKLHMQHGTLMS
jgi:hypothetical protein